MKIKSVLQLFPQIALAIVFPVFISCNQHLRDKQSSEEIVSLKMECQASSDKTMNFVVSSLQQDSLYQGYKNFDDKVRIFSDFKNFPGPEIGWWILATQYEAQCQYAIEITNDRTQDSVSHLSASVYIRIRPNEKWPWVLTSDYQGYGDDRARLLSELQNKLIERGLCR